MFERTRNDGLGTALQSDQPSATRPDARPLAFELSCRARRAIERTALLVLELKGEQRTL